jgi:hypothetical protein
MSDSNPKKDDIGERSQILLNEANILLDRYISNIDKINSKIISLFQIYLVLITIQIAIVSTSTTKIHSESYYIFGAIACLSVITIVYFSYLIWPKSYDHVEIFREQRFDELCDSGKNELLLDFIYHTRQSYISHEKNYKKLSFGLRVSIALIFINLITFSSIIFFIR